jgi:hypothetical protein
MHTVVQLVLPICSALIRKTDYQHSHYHAHCPVISKSKIQHWSIQLSTDIVIVMHTVLRLRLPYDCHWSIQCEQWFRDSTLIWTTVHRHSTCHGHRHAVSASDTLDTDPLFCSLTFHIAMHTTMRLVLPICSTLIHETEYRHSHCPAHCHAVGASDMLDTDPKTLFYQHSHCMLSVMWLVLLRFVTDPYNSLPMFTLSCTLSCD